ncbi:DUF6931 family protein [Novosphingobium sp.]|uniref:DUF6931 family protein n=1 Tax=Novosphingobium sp. TaxID=1874826 RepID=UPI003B51BCE3
MSTTALAPAEATQPWLRSIWSDSGQIARKINPDSSPDESDRLPPHLRFADLVRQGRRADAVFFVAYALPRYECAVWGAQILLEAGIADRHDPLMVAVLRWIDQPSDELRRHAGDLADATRRNSPARSLAHAVMMSGGSIAPPELPPVQPPPETCAALVAGAVLGGAHALPDAGRALDQALVLGDAIARGV